MKNAGSRIFSPCRQRYYTVNRYKRVCKKHLKTMKSILTNQRNFILFHLLKMLKLVIDRTLVIQHRFLLHALSIMELQVPVCCETSGYQMC